METKQLAFILRNYHLIRYAERSYLIETLLEGGKFGRVYTFKPSSQVGT